MREIFHNDKYYIIRTFGEIIHSLAPAGNYLEQCASMGRHETLTHTMRSERALTYPMKLRQTAITRANTNLLELALRERGNVLVAPIRTVRLGIAKCRVYARSVGTLSIEARER